MAQNPGRYYRPPHGLHTPFTRLFARLLGKRVVLWDLESKDWLNLPPEELAERLLFYLRPGSIVLLHDGPERTLRLLERALPEMLRLGYRPTTLDDLAPLPLTPRLALIRGLQGFEERYNAKHRVARAGLGPFDLFRIEKKPFPGPALPGLPPGVPAFELHLESQRLMELTPFEAVRHLRRSLGKVAERVAEDPEVRLPGGRGEDPGPKDPRPPLLAEACGGARQRLVPLALPGGAPQAEKAPGPDGLPQPGGAPRAIPTVHSRFPTPGTRCTANPASRRARLKAPWAE